MVCKIYVGWGRKDCGDSGTTEHDCYKKGCCWSPLHKNTLGPWCYESPSKLEIL